MYHFLSNNAGAFLFDGVLDSLESVYNLQRGDQAKQAQLSLAFQDERQGDTVLQYYPSRCGRTGEVLSKGS